MIDRDALYWQSIQASTDVKAFQAYLNNYPNGAYADLARIRIEELNHLQVVNVPPVTPTYQPVVPAPPLKLPTSPGTVFRDCPDCPEMVVIPPGSFTMGAAPGEDESEGLPQEFRGRATPQHRVLINTKLAVGRYAVTRGEFAAFIQDTGRDVSGCNTYDGSKWNQEPSKSWRNPGFDQTDRHPVVCVSWDDAQAYTRWLSQRTGQGYRLLSEAEWEYAARAGTTTRRYWGDDSAHTQQCRFVNGADQSAARQFNWSGVASCDDGYAYTAPVGSFQPNDFGLYDMLGNVWQWIEDPWHDNYQGASSNEVAWTIGGSNSARVVRGGSWYYNPYRLRSAFRSYITPDYRNYTFGLRLARTVNP